MPAVLKISDGSTEINLIKSHNQSGYHLARWRPAVPGYKGGGVWQDSPLADGRRPVHVQDENGFETFDLQLAGVGQDEAIRDTQTLRRLLRKATNYFISAEDEFVYIEARASCETNSRFAIVFDGKIPEDGSPYAQPFIQADGSAVMALTLVVERGPWTANRPGTGTCVQTSNVQSWTYEGEWLFNTTIAINDVWAIMQADNGYLFAGENRIDRSIDNGATWAVNFAGLNVSCRALLQAINGDIYAADNAAIWRTQNYGGAWGINHNPGAIQLYSLAQQAHNEYLYCGGVGVILRSINNGGAWGATAIAGHDFMSLLAASNGYVFGGSFHQSNPAIWRSVDDGATWQLNSSLPAHQVTSMVEVDGRILALSQGTMYIQRIIASDDWGDTWYVIANNEDLVKGRPATNSLPYRFLVAADGSVYLSGSFSTGARPVVVWRSQNRGDSWDRLVELTGGVATTGKGIGQAVYTDDRVYVGSVDVANDEIWRTGLTTDMGRAATCENEVYVPNKESVANLTHIKVFDSVAAPPADYTDIGIPMALPATLLPANPVVGDMIYFGIDSSVIPSGPFCSLVFDIETPATSTTSYTIVWEYWPATGPPWVALNVTDNTDQGSGVFSQFGVNSVHWVPPEDWITTAVDLVTGWWVRARVSALVGVLTPPVQARRNIYSVVQASVDVDDAQVRGDIPALLRFNLENQSDEDGYATVDELDLLDNRVVAGLRSLDRGPTFTAFLNCADEQNPPGVTAAVGTGTAFDNEVRTPTGRVATHTTQAGGLNRWDTAFTFTLGPAIAGDFYGTYHVFLRAQLYEPETAPAGDHEDVRVRLRVRSGSGGVTKTTGYVQFTGRDAWDAVAGREETYKDWHLLDFGQVELPATGLLRSDELPDELAVDIEIASAAGTNLRVDLYDLVLMPVDEWAGDLMDHAYEDDSCVENGYLLDVDSLAHPKRVIRSLVRTIAGLLRANWPPVGGSPAFLQANADQRLWFLSARGVVMGEEAVGGTAITLTDLHADFRDSGVRAGMIAYNVTTGNSAEITDVAPASCTTRVIAGNWNLNDAYFIVCPNWRSEPWNCHSVQLWANARYLSMRGAG